MIIATPLLALARPAAHRIPRARDQQGNVAGRGDDRSRVSDYRPPDAAIRIG